VTVLVLGAGVIGVTSAWFLREQGFDVRVLDRREGAALETSFANAGQVSAHLAEPWSNPSTLRNLPKWLLQRDAPLVWRPRLRADQWRWLAKFLRECTTTRYARNLLHLANLGLYSRETLKSLRARTGIVYDHHEGGILLFFTDSQAFEKAAATARRLARHGLERTVRSRDECLAIEPALHAQRDRLVGGIYSERDETGDAHQFTCALAMLGSDRGISFGYGANVIRLAVEGGEVIGAVVDHGDGRIETIRASHTVVCLGVQSAAVLRPLGVRLDIYPVKGYSVTLPVLDEAAAIRIGITDAGAKIAFSRLGSRLRATSTAEVADYDLSVDPKRCDALVRHTLRLFPGSGDAARAEYWAGLRPTTPSNLPYVGRSGVPGLYINAGHGTVGWTQSCGAGRALAAIVAGKRPEVAFPFYGTD
jgi:D-amino-acid dehydrogenase